MKVIKRNDSEQDFCIDKITQAVKKANMSVTKECQMREEDIQKIINTVRKSLIGFNVIKVEDIQDLVEKALVKHNKYDVSKAYILYRNAKKNNKKFTETEEKVLSVIKGISELRGDNANKNIDDNGTMRDYFAGILSKSITNKILPKKIIELHNSGKGHFHDADYHINPMHNCDLLNIEDMFKNGFQMQNTKIEPNAETPFRTACNLLAQINLIVSGRQYGGQTITWTHLIPFVKNSRNIIKKEILNDFTTNGFSLKEEDFNKLLNKKLKQEISEGIKTYQYQILCHSSSNGQTPFVSNNLCLSEAETKEELEDLALIIETILERRIKGVKDSHGHYITPLFPKLLYWVIDGLNLNENDPYFYLTKKAAQCISLRMQPDINSEKECRKIKKGQIIPSMGCRSWLSPIWEINEYPETLEKCWVEGISSNFVEIDKIQNIMDYSYPYLDFKDRKNFKEIPVGKYNIGKYRINFNGNTGWLLEKKGDKI
ncbi:MAG: hypothetical protein HUJ68_06725, partial [Clostridia bacterium]|nr:hypothetical protein [Clostridia bacterium]